VIWPLLRTRRWLGFTAVVIVAIVAFGLLSAWQWSRAEQHRNERIALDSALSTEAAPLTGEVPEWSPVTVTGVYDSVAQVVVRKRPLNATNGFWVMTPLATDDGRTAWVNRGWIPVGGDALGTPDLPPPPAGTVTVSGYARDFENLPPDSNEGLPPGQIAAVDTALLPAVTSGLGQYVQLTGSDPEQTGLVILPLPESSVDEGRNISYAVQWILFAFVAVGGWFFFLRREAREEQSEGVTPWTSA
jgi:cytochrome oxidase assembly protein ShyY1